MPEHIRQEPKVLVSTENLTEQEWLAYRRQGIGGSDVAAILGISPFRTARDLYDDKLNIASAVDDTGNWVALEMGHLLEPLVAQIFTKKTGLEVFQIKKMFQHPQYPFMLADVDYFVRLPNGEIALLEIKTTNYNAKDHWWNRLHSTERIKGAVLYTLEDARSKSGHLFLPAEDLTKETLLLLNAPIVGHKPILFMAVHRADISKRNTMLGERIRLYCKAYHTERNVLPELQQAG